jgi:hypothetical protein
VSSGANMDEDDYDNFDGDEMDNDDDVAEEEDEVEETQDVSNHAITELVCSLPCSCVVIIQYRY